MTDKYKMIKKKIIIFTKTGIAIIKFELAEIKVPEVLLRIIIKNMNIMNI